MPIGSQQRTVPSGAILSNTAAIRLRFAAVGRTDAGVCSRMQRASTAAATSSDVAIASSYAAPGASSATARGSTTLNTNAGGTDLRHLRSVPTRGTDVSTG